MTLGINIYNEVRRIGAAVLAAIGGVATGVNQVEVAVDGVATSVGDARDDIAGVATSISSQGIKSVQRGVLTIANGASSASATITAVNTGKAELRMLGYACSTFGDGSNGAHWPGYVRLANATTVTAQRVTTQADCSISWELTEWKS